MKIEKILKIIAFIFGIVYACFILNIIMSLIISVCFNKYDNYKDISKYVNKNYNYLEEKAKKCINDNKISCSKITKGYPIVIKKITVLKKDEERRNTIVEFMTAGRGLVPSSTYIGFYYSEDDVPASFQNGTEELKQIEKNEWEWIGNGDNHGKTTKIRKKWYYFEASF